MKTDQDLKFHKGQEFTKKDDSRVHCIVQSYIEGEQAYLVTYTCSGHSKKVSESDLEHLYAPSSDCEKRKPWGASSLSDFLCEAGS
jgi:hypothetical protein